MNHAPTEAQKVAGNYAKEHISFQGLPISIENKKGSERSGIGPDGKRWRCTLPADYGYIKRTEGAEGADGDHVDVYVGPHKGSRQVFLVNQVDHKTGKFDEHKAMLGYHSEREALADYCRAFSDGHGHARVGSVEAMSIDGFKHWLKDGNTKRPAHTRHVIDRALLLARKGTNGRRGDIHV